MNIFHLRNLPREHQAPKTGSYPETSSSATVEDREDRAKPPHSDASTEPVLIGGAAEKNRNCINYERQQVQFGMSGLDGAMPTLLSRPVAVKGGDRSHHAQFTQEDLETSKLDLNEVQRNLRESSDESLMEHSQKQFSSEETAGSQVSFCPLADTTADIRASQVLTPASVLPKQQNVPKRPSSLSLHSKSAAASSLRMKFGKLSKSKSNLKKPDVGVARTKSAPEPHPVKVIANNAVSTIMANLSTQVPQGGGASANESKGKDGVSSDEMSFGILIASPDEQEPLLRRDTKLENNTNNNNSNNNGDDGDGDGESEGGDGGGGETGESTAPVGETSSSSVTEPSPPCPAVLPMTMPQPTPPTLTQGEALLRQNRGRRPERPNSLDLSITTLPLLGEERTIRKTSF